MTRLAASWQAWALASAGFAALTAILAKLGVANVGSDYATLVRTAVVLCLAAAIVAASGQWPASGSVPARSYVFLVLSGLAAGASQEGAWVGVAGLPALGVAAAVEFLSNAIGVALAGSADPR